MGKFIVSLLVFQVSLSSHGVMLPGYDFNPDGPRNHLSSQRRPIVGTPFALVGLLQKVQLPTSPQMSMRPNIGLNSMINNPALYEVHLAFYELLLQLPETEWSEYSEAYFLNAGETSLVETLSYRDEPWNLFFPYNQNYSRRSLNLVEVKLHSDNEFVLIEPNLLIGSPFLQAYFRLRAIYKTFIMKQIYQMFKKENFSRQLPAIEAFAEAAFLAYSRHLRDRLRQLPEFLDIIDSETHRLSVPEEFQEDAEFYWADISGLSTVIDPDRQSTFVENRLRDSSFASVMNPKELYNNLKSKMATDPTANEDFSIIYGWAYSKLMGEISGRNNEAAIAYVEQKRIESMENGDFVAESVALRWLNQTNGNEFGVSHHDFYNAAIEMSLAGSSETLRELKAASQSITCGQALEP